MRLAKITRGEKRLLAAAAMAACLVGSLAGYAAYEHEAEAQFHGGVLPEDAAEARLALAWQFVSAFARWGGGIALIAGIAPIAARRFIKGNKG